VFPKRLHEARKAAGLTMDELALIYNQHFKSGINKSTISKYENNRQNPMTKVVSNLAEILNVSTDYLLGKSDCTILEEWKNKLGAFDGLAEDDMAILIEMAKHLRAKNVTK